MAKGGTIPTGQPYSPLPPLTLPKIILCIEVPVQNLKRVSKKTPPVMGPVGPYFHFMAIHPMEEISSVSAVKCHLFCSPIKAPVCILPKDQGTSWDNHGFRCAEKVIQESPRSISLFIHVRFVPSKAPACTYSIGHIILKVWDLSHMLVLWSPRPISQQLHHIFYRFHYNFPKILQKMPEYLYGCKCE